METLNTFAAESLALLEKKHLGRSLITTERHEGVMVYRNGKSLISFSSNDYLGLSRHPQVIMAAQMALTRYGAGAGASRLAGGEHPLYAELESLLSELKHTEAALVFGSGYLSNLGAIPALVGPHDLIIADKLVHACMIDAAKLSGATLMRYAHNNLEHCHALLEDHRNDYQRCIILTETVFSMDGDVAPVKSIAALARRYDAWVMVDDAHGLGVLPDATEGADIIMGTLSKAAGTYGGYVCASKKVIQLLQSNARSLVFSTALPPATIAAAIASISIIQKDSELREIPLKRAQYFSSIMKKSAAQSAVYPVIIGEAERAIAVSQHLEASGFYVPAIRPPTVPPATARLRFAFTAQHTEDHLNDVAAALRGHL